MAHVLEGHYEEVEYAGQWPSSAEHKVKAYTKVTTRTWPPDAFFQEAEAKRSERLRQEAELEAMQREVQRRKEALDAFDRAASAAAAAPRYVPPPLPNISTTPPRLSTKVVIKKWPPDSWFEDERKKAAKPKQYAQPAQSSGAQQQSPQGYGGADLPYPGAHSAYSMQPGVEHHPVPIDPNTRMYNPHGFWPYSQGQPRVQPPSMAALRLREETPALEAARAEALAAQGGSPYASNPYPVQAAYADPYPQEHHQHQHQQHHAPPAQEVQRAPRQDAYPVQAAQPHAQHQHGTMHAHHEEHHHPRAMHGQPVQPSYLQEQEEMFELGDHFQCLGCGCHIRPSEVVYRPRTVPMLPPDVAHEPVALEKPDGRKVDLRPKPKPKPPVQLPRMPSLQLPPEPPREELAIKDVPVFDFDGAREEGLKRAQQEKAEEYGIKTVENFDFEAAQRAGQAQAQAPQQQQQQQAEAGDDRVKAVEDFDFEGARRQGAQPAPAAPPPQAEAPRNPALAAMRARVQAAAQARYEDGA